MNFPKNSTKIRNLSPESFNAIVSGIILYRSPNRSGKTLTLLLRDARDSSVVCVIWGPQTFIQDWWTKCEIGQTLTVTSVRVSKSTNEFHPLSTSPFIITASDCSKLTISDAGMELLYVPLKPIEGTLTLDDIKITGEKGIGRYVDVFVLVRQLKPVRQITLKAGGTQKSLRECVLCDQSNAGMLFTMWSEDFLVRSEKWQATNQVLHVMDVKIGYSSYYKSIFLMTTSKTVIMESPDHGRTQELLEFGLQLDPFDSTAGNNFNNILPAPEAIQEVMSCQRVTDRMTMREGIGDEDQFTAVIFGIVTKFDIDQLRNVVKKKCSFCHSSLTNGECMEDICLDLRYQTSDTTYQVFDLLVDFSDHSGSLTNCRLLNAEAEKLLGCSADDFQASSWSEQCAKKWEFLMERCRVKVVVYKRTVYRQRSFIRVVEMKLADHYEVKQKIKIY